IIKNYKKEYHDARHVCSAYKTGGENGEWKANDDGEPSGTAGKPILGQINSFELTNVIVLVVRYFGGILLGTGGLATAYKAAAADALTNAEIVEKFVTETFTLQYDYALTNDVMHLIKELNANILQQDYNDGKCMLTASVRKDNYSILKEKVKNIWGVELIK
ncbi:MAG: YigZ family protein, partial [Paludibacter sp.]|nr:YigZ family protein [Paludibacter sp.]